VSDSERTYFSYLQNRDGALSFATDAWTSPNHKAFVAITVHFEIQGLAKSLLLDIVEVPCSHTGLNLASVFADVLQEFGLQDKVSICFQLLKCL
jgi:hypothetical protein